MEESATESFSRAVKELIGARKLSLRQVEQKTGIDHTTIFKMTRGRIPRKDVVIDFAVGMGVSVNEWLIKAGYDPLRDSEIPKRIGRRSIAADSGPSPPRTKPDIPTSVHGAIATARTREEKINIAFEYLYLRGEEFGVTGMGAHNMHKNDTEAKLAIIRLAERSAGVRLLPPDIV